MSETTTPSVLAGLQPLADFCAEVRRNPDHVKQRWIKKGLPVTRVGRDIYVDPVKARAWIERGMTPEPQRPRRRKSAP